MTPAQFVDRIRKGLAPAYLFLGNEHYQRRRCRAALIDAVLEPEERESGLTVHELSETSLRDAIDDARSLSLFASKRLIILSSAEAALPRGRAAAAEDDDGEGTASGDAAALDDYLADPTPEVTLLIEAVRFDWEGDDKKKLERAAKFYGSVRDVVELKRYPTEEAAREAQALAKAAGVRFEREAFDLLIESLAADVARIAVEIDKLALFAGRDRAVTVDDVASLVPDARATTIFALVNALGRKDRGRSLQILDTLTREGEYLPLALAFLGTQFRMALAAVEGGVRGPGQIQQWFSRQGVPMWQSRAEQIANTAQRFSREQLQRGLKLIYDADVGLRSARPDDRVVMENFIVRLTA